MAPMKYMPCWLLLDAVRAGARFRSRKEKDAAEAARSATQWTASLGARQTT